MSKRGLRRSCVRRVDGFTLIELMTAIAVLAVMMAIAVPSFSGLINSNRLVTHSNEMVASLQLARSEAIRRNARVEVCASSDGATCDTSTTPWTQWLVVLVSSSEVLRINKVKGDTISVTPSAAITDNGNAVVFSPDGLARDATNALLVASIAVCMETARPEENTKRVSIAAGSRIRTISENTNASCDTPDDD